MCFEDKHCRLTLMILKNKAATCLSHTALDESLVNTVLKIESIYKVKIHSFMLEDSWSVMFAGWTQQLVQFFDSFHRCFTHIEYSCCTSLQNCFIHSSFEFCNPNRIFLCFSL